MRKWEPVKNHPNIYSYPTAKGKRFGVRRGYSDVLGKNTEFTKSGFNTWREAEIVLKKFESDLALNKFDNLASEKVTLQKTWEMMKDEKKRLGKWRPSTEESQINNYLIYIKNPLGNKSLSQIKRPVVQKWLDSLSTQNLAHDTIRSAYGTLSQIINYAVNTELIGSNRIRGLDYTGKDPKDKSIEPIDFNRWMKCAEAVLNNADYAMIVVMANTGMRRGEVTGLRTTAVTIKENELTREKFAMIDINFQRSVNNPNGAKLKTKSSYRKIAVTDETTNYLQKAIDIAEARRKKGHKSPNAIPWLWVKEDGDPVSVFHLRYLCQVVSNKCGIHMHPHMFRHYFATETIANGVPQIDVMHYLGHSSVQMTADYTRPTENASLNVSKGFTPTDTVPYGTINRVPSNVP